MRIAFLGTRGVPARYGGFETAVEEIGHRLSERGHEVVVYCRNEGQTLICHRGMRLVNLPALRLKVGETLSHTLICAFHLLRNPVDVALLFNAANATLIPLIRLGRPPVALHMDGLEWQRGKWGRAGRHYYLAAERLGVRLADSIIADSEAIQDYYIGRYGVQPVLLSYGAPVREDPQNARLAELELEPFAYHLVVARFEPENHVDVALDGFAKSGSSLPFVVVGAAAYPGAHARRIEELAGADDRVRLLGALWDQDLLDQLYGNCASYIHGHSVGGTNPSLLRAMGSGAPVLALDVSFAREVAGECGRYFSDAAELSRLLGDVERDRAGARERGRAGRRRVKSRYDWDRVAEGYDELCQRLAGNARARRMP